MAYHLWYVINEYKPLAIISDCCKIRPSLMRV